MALPIYLAMTDWEFRHCAEPPEHSAWMACHFSSYGSGLTNIPERLPENSLLMINDRTPPQGHDPALIAQQLLEAVEYLKPRGVLLDFQRSFNEETGMIAKTIQKALPCPVAVTAAYEQGWDGPVFLPPIPLNMPLQEYLKPWRGRDIWLETEKTGLCLVLTQSGCAAQPFIDPLQEPIFQDHSLHCHYCISVSEKNAEFRLLRTDEDRAAMLAEAEELGVSVAVGLFQEFG